MIFKKSFINFVTSNPYVAGTGVVSGTAVEAKTSDGLACPGTIATFLKN